MAPRIPALARYVRFSNPVESTPGGRFPHVSGFDLEGRRLQIPDDLSGPTVVAIAYRQHQQADIDTWMSLLVQLEDEGVDVFELPTIRPLGVVGQTWLDTAMRMGIPDPGARRRTVTLYLDVATFNEALGIPGTEAIQTLVLDADGTVLARVPGRRSTSGTAEVLTALEVAGWTQPSRATTASSDG